MKKQLLGSIILSTVFSIQTAVSQVDEEYSNELLAKIEQVKKRNKSGGYHSITPLLREAKRNESKLTERVKKSSGMDVPTLSGEEEVYQTEYFDIHYTETGVDAVDLTDDDNNGVPDFVEQMGEIADHVFDVDKERGYNMPPSDEGSIGDSEYYDIYISSLKDEDTGDDYYGSVTPYELVGDNPATSLVEVNSKTSWMGMNNDYSWLDAVYYGETTVEEVLKVTLAHELCHSIDMGYNAEMSQFFLEAKGAYEEFVLYPELSDNFQYIPSIFHFPEIALNFDQDKDPDVEITDDYNSHWYAGWLFFKYLTELTGGDQIVIDFVEAAASENDEAIFMNDVLQNKYASLDLDLEDIFELWTVTNALDIQGEFKVDGNPISYDDRSAYDAYMAQTEKARGCIIM